eukprot:15334380-Ditylum_brightwellii.AAC.1
MEKGTTNVQQWMGWDVHYAVCPNADEFAAQSCGGVAQRNKLVNLEFHSIAAEEMMAFVSPDEEITASLDASKMNKPHISTHISLAEKRHKYARHIKYFTSHSAPDCNIIAHTITQGDHTYYMTKITHPLAVELGNHVRSQLPKLSSSMN